MSSAIGPDQLPPKIDTTVPHSARIWNYWLGGKDNYPVDRAAGDQYKAVFPSIVEIARASRAFLGRSVRYLAGEVGIRQFLDIGTGLPTADNTHEIAQRVAPEARVVYVDNDPLVLVHAKALLTGTVQGATEYIDADMNKPDVIVERAAKLLDLSQPVGLLFMQVLGHINDYHDARRVVARLLEPLARGSHLVLCDGIREPAADQAAEEYAETGAVPYVLRSLEQLTEFFGGLELVEPGFVPVTRWRPDDPADPGPDLPAYAGVARKV